MPLTITRTPEGAPLFPGGETRELRADFGLANTSMPAWLTPAPDSSAAGTTMITGVGSGVGELTLTTAAEVNNSMSLNLPQVDLTKFSYVKLEVGGLRCHSALAARMYLALASRSDIAYNTDVGATLQKVANEPYVYLRRTNTNIPSEGPNSGNTGAMAFAPFAAGRRWDMSIVMLPQEGMIYAMMGDQVMHARDVSSGMKLGVVTPHIRVETNAATAQSLSFSSIALSLKAL